RLTLAGYRSGYFSAAEENEVVAQVNAARPDILWVGMGAPAEQRFCLRVRARLSNVGLIKTSGGLFDFVSGRNSRAPGWRAGPWRETGSSTGRWAPRHT